MEFEDNDCLYGEQTHLTLENMSFSGHSLSEFPEYIESLLIVKEACAKANHLAGILDRDLMVQITQACRKAGSMTGEERQAAFPADVFAGGGGIGINMNVNEVLSALTGYQADPIDHINMCQSTSDVCHTALRIAVLKVLGNLEKRLDDFISCLDQKIQEFRGITTIARTCLQDGMQVDASALWEGVRAAAARSRDRLEECRDMMHKVNLGGTVIGNGTGADPAYLAQVMDQLSDTAGFELQRRESLYDAAQNPDDLYRVSSEVMSLGLLISKFSRDLRLLSSGPETGLMELTVPPVQKGSSFFPGKVNPVIPEMMIQCGFLMRGNHMIICSAMESGEMHLNIWEEMMGFLLMQNIAYLNKALHLFTERCLKGVTCRKDICMQYAEASIPMIVKYKELFGYQETSRRIRQDGMDGFLRQCRLMEEMNKKKTHNQETNN